MTDPDPTTLRSLLDETIDPATGRTLRDCGLIEGLSVRDGMVFVALKSAAPDQAEALRHAITARLGVQPGIRGVQLALTAHRAPPASQSQGPAQNRAEKPKLLPDIRFKIAVASGKGGVGKSTTAVNLAVALAALGWRVGLLDADIYGPSVPIMTGLQGQPEVRDGLMEPMHAWGISIMSIGFLVNPETALIWRGPMVMGALEKLLGQTGWGALDALVVDMPPGTGDAQLTMAQRVDLAGAVIVSTPQDVALQDARRGVRMFEKVGVPILGLIENMSGFCCPNCGHTTDIFGAGGARDQARAMDVPYLGGIPLLPTIRDAADRGTPVAARDPDSAEAAFYIAIAAKLQAKLLATAG